MKKIFSLILVLMLAACPAFADGEIDAVRLENGVEVQADLDGDGAEEVLLWRTATVDEYDAAFLQVWESNGKRCDWMSGMLYGAEVYYTDMDADGKTEIFISGDEMSDDYITYCLNYTGDTFVPLRFADVNRGENTDGYYEFGYGKIVSLNGTVVTLSGSQDIFGTFMMERTMMLENGVFEAEPSGFWHRSGELTDEDWEYCALTVLQDIPCDIYGEDMPEPATLYAGERIIIVATDKISQASFVTEDGRTGTLTIAPDTERGWGYTVNGLPEDEVFGNILYAD